MLRFLHILTALAPIVLSVSQSFGEASARVVLSGTVAHKDGGYLLKLTAPVPNSVDAVTILRSGPADAGMSARALRDALLKIEAKQLQIGEQQVRPFVLKPAEQKGGSAIAIGTDRPGLTCWVKRQADQAFFKLEPSKPVTLNNITFEYVRDASNPSALTGEAATTLQESALCPPAQDQTGTASRVVYVNNKLANGWGLFLIPDPEKPVPLNEGVKLVCDLTYQQVKDRGANCFAFRWVADSVQSCEEAQEILTLKDSPCIGRACPCQIPCMCDPAKAYCVGGVPIG